MDHDRIAIGIQYKSMLGFCQTVCDEAEVSRGCREGSAGFETSNQLAGAELGSLHHRHPDTGAVDVEWPRHDADQRSRPAVQNKCFAQNAGITAEFGLPHSEIHHEYRRCVWLSILGCDRPSQKRGHAIKIKGARADLGRGNQTRTASIAKDHAEETGVICDQVLENVVLFLKSEEFLPAEPVATRACSLIGQILDGESYRRPESL
jgi:hypothetical protein